MGSYLPKLNLSLFFQAKRPKNLTFQLGIIKIFMTHSSWFFQRSRGLPSNSGYCIKTFEAAVFSLPFNLLTHVSVHLVRLVYLIVLSAATKWVHKSYAKPLTENSQRRLIRHRYRPHLCTIY